MFGDICPERFASRKRKDNTVALIRLNGIECNTGRDSFHKCLFTIAALRLDLRERGIIVVYLDYLLVVELIYPLVLSLTKQFTAFEGNMAFFSRRSYCLFPFLFSCILLFSAVYPLFSSPYSSFGTDEQTQVAADAFAAVELRFTVHILIYSAVTAVAA